MAEYLEREKIMEKARLACLIALCDEDPNLYPDVDFADTFAVDLDDICEMDAADVAPVAHGYWKDGFVSFGARPGTFQVCSRCNICFRFDYSVTPREFWQYCPNCGAKMDAKGRETDG